MPVNLGRPAPAKDNKAAGTQRTQVAKGDPGGKMFGDALKRLGTAKRAKASASTSNVARQGLAKVDRVTGPRGKVRRGTTR